MVRSTSQVGNPSVTHNHAVEQTAGSERRHHERCVAARGTRAALEGGAGNCGPLPGYHAIALPRCTRGDAVQGLEFQGSIPLIFAHP
jgi:hypothetical protein